LRPVQPGEETGGAGTVLYEGAGLPAVSWDTRTFADGAYDLVLLVRTDKGRTLEVQERILVDNWEVLEEPFKAPIAFFGMQVDSQLKASATTSWFGGCRAFALLSWKCTCTMKLTPNSCALQLLRKGANGES